MKWRVRSLNHVGIGKGRTTNKEVWARGSFEAPCCEYAAIRESVDQLWSCGEPLLIAIPGPNEDFWNSPMPHNIDTMASYVA